jgi:arginine utilization protein RocB
MIAPSRWKIAVPAAISLCTAVGASNAQVASPGADEACVPRAVQGADRDQHDALRRQLHAGGGSDARRLLAAGYAAEDMQILAPPDAPNDGALIAVLHGREKGAEPILLLAHIDVVEARREDWTRDPFKLVEEGGWFYARGASDDKAMAAIFTDSLVRYKQEGYKPRRDIKLALTCGEETAGAGLFDSVRWLVKTRPEVLHAAFAINEGAGGELDRNGKPVALNIQAGEKVYQDFASK